MNNLPQTNTCPQCRAPLPADAPQGLCPACLLAAVAEPTEAGPAPLAKSPPPTREQVAAAFPQLEILELIGAGGMGFVFKARQPKLDRLVALKLLPPHLGADAAFAGRFEREGRVLARLSHPNIVTVHDFGFASSPSTLNSQLSTSSAGFYYLLMEFVDGVNLRQAMRAGRFTPVQALEVVPKICEALQFAHEQGVLHRDIKPENILLDSKGRVKLADFGIAKLTHRDGDTPVPESDTQPHTKPNESVPDLGRIGDKSVPVTALTSATAALGTPSYMAPEQRDRPAAVDHRADIYSLGVVFYEMLTGELPQGKFPAPSAKAPLDPRVDAVVLRALEHERERRQQSAGEMKTQVETIATTPGSSRLAEAPPPVPNPSPIPPDQAIEPFAHLGFFRRSLGWGVFLGVLATLVLVIGLTMVIGGTALSEWLRNSPMFSSRKPPTTAHAPAAPTNAPAKAIPAKLAPDLSAKHISFKQITNLNGHAYLTSHTLLAPGESFQGWLVLPDGSRERASSSESVFSHGGKESGICGWTWRLPPPFNTNRVDEVVTQLRERWEGKLLACPPGQPVSMFTLTNKSGVKISGEVQFNRTTVDPDKPAVAEVRLRNQMTSLMFFTSQVPDGYALHIRPLGTEIHAAHPNLHRSYSKYAEDSHCSWSWIDFEYGPAHSAAAGKQMQALFAQGPLLVTNGQPRTLFSITNANGKVYAGQFELRGPDFVPPPVPAVKPRAVSLPQSSPSTEPPKPSTPEGLALMARLRERYDQATNLVVEGHTVTTMIRANQPAFVRTNQFEMKLGRPSLYQVRWTSSPVGTHVHQGVGVGDWFWMNGSDPVAQASRELALGGGVGVSQNVSGWLPSLFFGKAAWVQVLGDLKVEPDAVINGEPCAVLVGEARGNSTRLWISKRDFLLRQAESLNTITAEQMVRISSDTLPAGSSIRIVQTYRRVLTGQNLTPSDFKFTPPAAK